MFIYNTKESATKAAKEYLGFNPDFIDYEVFDCIYGWTFSLIRSSESDFSDIPF